MAILGKNYYREWKPCFKIKFLKIIGAVMTLENIPWIKWTELKAVLRVLVKKSVKLNYQN